MKNLYLPGKRIVFVLAITMAILPCLRASSFALFEVKFVGARLGYIDSEVIDSGIVDPDSTRFLRGTMGNAFSQERLETYEMPLMADPRVSLDLSYAPVDVSGGALPSEVAAAGVSFIMFQPVLAE